MGSEPATSGLESWLPPIALRSCGTGLFDRIWPRGRFQAIKRCIRRLGLNPTAIGQFLSTSQGDCWQHGLNAALQFHTGTLPPNSLRLTL